MNEQNPDTLEGTDPTPDPAPEPAPTPAPEPAPDTHAGFAVYDETLTRYVSEVFRGGKSNGKTEAEADAKTRRKDGPKGHRYSVKAV